MKSEELKQRRQLNDDLELFWSDLGDAGKRCAGKAVRSQGLVAARAMIIRLRGTCQTWRGAPNVMSARSYSNVVQQRVGDTPAQGATEP